MLPFRAAIFDMDGTLTQSTHIWDGVTDRYIEQLGHPLPEHYYQRIQGRTYEQAMAGSSPFTASTRRRGRWSLSSTR